MSVPTDFKTHISQWIAGFSPIRDADEVEREFDELLNSYYDPNWYGYQLEDRLKMLVEIDKLLGFAVEYKQHSYTSSSCEETHLLRNFDVAVPEPGCFFINKYTTPGCCWDKEHNETLLVVQRGFFTCTVKTFPGLEASFANSFIVRVGEDVMRKKFLAAFEPDHDTLKWLDQRVLRDYIDGRDNNLPRSWCETSEQGWSGKFFREEYAMEVGALQPNPAKPGEYYIVRRVAVFTCDVQFFSSKEEGDVVEEEMRVEKAAYAEVLRAEKEKFEELVRSYSKPAEGAGAA
jgi:hypothetical protein